MNWDRLLELDSHWSQRLSVADRPGPTRTLATILAHSGDSWFWLIGLAVVALLSPGSMRLWSIQVGGVVVVAAAMVLGIKFSIRRRRPEGEWGEVYRRTDPHSFPSGHAARSILLAVLVLGWGPASLVPILLIWSPLVVLARVAMGVHYLSDVLAGAMLGLLLGGAALLALPTPF